MLQPNANVSSEAIKHNDSACALNVPVRILPADQFAAILAQHPAALAFSAEQSKEFLALVAQHPEVHALMEQAKNYDNLLPQTFVVTTHAEYASAADGLQQVKGTANRMEEVRLSFTRPLDAMKKILMNYFNSSPLDKVEQSYKTGMLAFTAAQEVIRQQEQLAADTLARQAQAKLQVQAAKAAASGKVERAALLEERACAVVAPIINRDPAPIAGISSRENWFAECTDLMALVKAIADGKAPLSLVIANTKVLSSQAKSLKSDFKAPGVRVWSGKNIASSAA